MTGKWIAPWTEQYRQFILSRIRARCGKDEAEVARLTSIEAYVLWQSGRGAGDSTADWLMAERQVFRRLLDMDYSDFWPQMNR